MGTLAHKFPNKAAQAKVQIEGRKTFNFQLTNCLIVYKFEDFMKVKIYLPNLCPYCKHLQVLYEEQLVNLYDNYVVLVFFCH